MKSPRSPVAKAAATTATGPGPAMRLVKKPAAKQHVATASPARKKSVPAAYHHGALQEALLRAAEKLLERDGLPGLTLRAVAREAGVSHAAPAHHFGDLAGLVSDLAAIGYRSFNDALIAAAATGSTPVESGLARARAYLNFARTRPGMYRLMFRSERLDMKRPGLNEAADAAFASLARTAGADQPGDVAVDALTLTQAARIAGAWSLVHGFAMLTLDGRLNDMLRRLPEGTDVDTLFVETLKVTLPVPV